MTGVGEVGADRQHRILFEFYPPCFCEGGSSEVGVRDATGQLDPIEHGPHPVDGWGIGIPDEAVADQADGGVLVTMDIAQTCCIWRSPGLARWTCLPRPRLPRCHPATIRPGNFQLTWSSSRDVLSFGKHGPNRPCVPLTAESTNRTASLCLRSEVAVYLPNRPDSKDISARSMSSGWPVDAPSSVKLKRPAP